VLGVELVLGLWLGLLLDLDPRLGLGSVLSLDLILVLGFGLFFVLDQRLSKVGLRLRLWLLLLLVSYLGLRIGLELRFRIGW
jgi:hypothetical protein